MDQISPDEGTPEQRRPERRQQDRVRPDPIQRAAQPRPISVAHPVVAGYNGSASARNALAYAAGMARRLGRPLLMVYVTSPGVYCEPLTGQVVGVVRDADSLERWLLTELDQAADASELEVHVRTRRGSPARELASIAAEFSADALVIGAPRHFWHHIIGSVPSWLARNARCPVIVVPLSSSSGQPDRAFHVPSVLYGPYRPLMNSDHAPAETRHERQRPAPTFPTNSGTGRTYP